jgi:hypothetical protein
VLLQFGEKRRFYVSREPQTQQTLPALGASARVLQQECYLPILAQTFLIAQQAEGRSVSTLEYYREKINPFLEYCESQAVTQIRDVTPDLLRRFMFKIGETHNPPGPAKP